MPVFNSLNASATARNKLCGRFDVYCSVPVITEAEARSALIQYCSGHCCYGKGAATDMVIMSMESSAAYHVRLKNFCNIVCIVLQVHSFH